MKGSAKVIAWEIEVTLVFTGSYGKIQVSKIKLLEENTEPFILPQRQKFPEHTIESTIKENSEKLDYVKHKNVCESKDTFNRMNN